MAEETPTRGTRRRNRRHRLGGMTTEPPPLTPWRPLPPFLPPRVDGDEMGEDVAASWRHAERPGDIEQYVVANIRCRLPAVGHPRNDDGAVDRCPRARFGAGVPKAAGVALALSDVVALLSV